MGIIASVVTKLKKHIPQSNTAEPNQTPSEFLPTAGVMRVAKNIAVETAREKLEIVPTKKNSQIIGANWLIDFKNNQQSEHGEDGIIAKIFELLKPKNKWVCEFGAHDPEVISNTWRLIHQEGWNALLIEADDHYFGKLQKYYQDSQTVHCVKSMVSFEGQDKLDSILKETPTPTDLDFMVIDIDGNDYHVWGAIELYQANVVMIEFNASIPSHVVHVQPRDLAINQGSSLAAMVSLAKRKGYKLIAVTAWNAFFVKNEFFHLFFKEEPPLAEMYVYPAKHPIWMRAFQLYDGTLVIAAWNEMLWHNINLKPADYQVLPESYRHFSLELAMKPYCIDLDGSMTSIQEENNFYLQRIFKMPANKFSAYAHDTHSRFGEDGIIEKLVAVVPVNHLYIVDVGAGNGVSYSKSRNLVERHAWRGLLIENQEDARKTLIENTQQFPQATVHPVPCFTSKNTSLDMILKQHNVPVDFDVLTINVYGMDYYIWESLLTFSPKIVAVQFNPTVPNDVSFVQLNDFAVHQGCSLRALHDLAHYKGYELVACTMDTAFFIKRNYFYRCFEIMGIKDVDLDEMFSPVQMNLFQLYDGTIMVDGLNRLLWHAMRIDLEKLQVVPAALRKFHQYADKEYKKYFYRVD